MTCPCKDCTPETGRTPTCHASCKKYLHWRRVKDLRKQRKDREAAANNAIDALIYEKSEKKKAKMSGFVADVADKRRVGNTLGNSKNPVVARVFSSLLPLLP